MTTFESQLTRIKKKPEELFGFFSDLNNIGKYKNKVPSDKFKEIEYTTDSFSFTISPVGKIVFKVSERIPYEKVRFVTQNMPMDVHVEVTLNKTEENETDFQLIAEADLNPFLKPMVSKPLQEAVDKMAGTFALLFNQEA